MYCREAGADLARPVPPYSANRLLFARSSQAGAASMTDNPPAVMLPAISRGAPAAPLLEHCHG
jgi:hypothetical protein